MKKHNIPGEYRFARRDIVAFFRVQFFIPLGDLKGAVFHVKQVSIFDERPVVLGTRRGTDQKIILVQTGEKFLTCTRLPPDTDQNFSAVLRQR